MTAVETFPEASKRATSKVDSKDCAWWEARADAGYVDELDDYEFVADNPINGLDPTGLKRIIFAFEGLGGFNAAQKQAVLGDATGQTKPDRYMTDHGNASYAFLLELVRVAGLTTDSNDVVNYYAQNSVDSAVQDAIKTVQGNKAIPQLGSPGPRATCHNSIVVVGFSNGGDAAIQFAGDLKAKGIKIDLGFTVDPVPKGLGVFYNNNGFAKPANATTWINYYENFHGTLGIIGHPVNGADNNDQDVTAQVVAEIKSRYDLSKLPLGVGGHTTITKLPSVIKALQQDVSNVALHSP